MNPAALSYRAPLDGYEREALTLLDDLNSGAEAAAWRFKWMHPRFRGRSVDDVRHATLDLADSRLVVAREYAFEDWGALATFVETIAGNGPVSRFEAAVEAVVSGDLDALRSMLNEDPELVRARSSRCHRATLLHYVGANGVEAGRQKTSPNAVEIAKALLEAGAEVDALADLYDAKCTTMSMLVSSSHPAEAGLQAALAETLVDYGARLVGPGSRWQSAIMTALAFGYQSTAQALARRTTPADDIAAASGLGRLPDVIRLLPCADAQSRHVALALAAQHGHSDIVELFLDAGEDPNRYNPEGYHPHSTPLHQAVWAGHASVVRLLAERGARLDIRDAIYQATPLGWATHGNRTEIAEFLRKQAERGSS